MVFAIPFIVPYFGTSSDYLCAMKITHYCRTQEDALRKAKQVAKQPGYYYYGTTLADGRKGFAVYKNGNLVERYLAFKKKD